MSKVKKLNNSIFELIKEVEKEIEEATTGGSIAGYETPNAFGDDSEKSKNKTKEVSTQAGYTVVAGDIENINESPTKKEPKFSESPRNQQLAKVLDYLNSIKIDGAKNSVEKIVKLSKARNGWNVTYKSKPGFVDDRDSQYASDFIYPHELGESIVNESSNHVDIHINPQVANLYKKWVDAKKNNADGSNELYYYQRKLNNTYTTPADRQYIKHALKAKYGYPLNESPNEGKLLPKKLTDLKMGELFSFDGNTYTFIELRPGKDSAKVKDKNGNVSVNSFGGGLVNRKTQGSGFGDYLSQGGRVWDHKTPTNIDMLESEFKGNIANDVIDKIVKQLSYYKVYRVPGNLNNKIKLHVPLANIPKVQRALKQLYGLDSMIRMSSLGITDLEIYKDTILEQIDESYTLGLSGVKNFAKKHGFGIKVNSTKNNDRVTFTKDGKDIVTVDPSITTKDALSKKLGINEGTEYTKDEFIKKVINAALVNPKSGQSKVSIDGLLHYIKRSGLSTITKNDIVNVAKTIPSIKIKSDTLMVNESINEVGFKWPKMFTLKKPFKGIDNEYPKGQYMFRKLWYSGALYQLEYSQVIPIRSEEFKKLEKMGDIVVESINEATSYVTIGTNTYTDVDYMVDVKTGKLYANVIDGGGNRKNLLTTTIDELLRKAGRNWKWTNVGKQYYSTQKTESITENRWLDLKNDESMHPHKKLAVGLKELRNQLSEVEKFLGWYNKLKNINELDTDNYWKRTNNNIYKIKERIINIAKTLKEIEN